MRLYIGIDLPPHIKRALFKFQLRLKKLGVKGAWKASESFHITLEFLGKIPPESIPSIVQLLETVVRDKKMFKLHIDNPGAFPSFHRCHSLWAGVGGHTEELDQIRSELHEALASNGFMLQRAPFIPHITLLTNPKTPMPDQVSFSLRKAGTFRVSEFVLFESKSEKGKRLYIYLYRAGLKR
ncbi:MAG: RNA 2',3'-cyclic phosphodiesterase [Bacteroidota bacterium]|nr:RNA 2',3'-cyclic phosphodiesterase [Bacteroidota bacterium]